MARRQPKICAHCQQPFIAKRKDAKTCSAQCRKALSRAQQALAREAERIEVRIETAAREVEQTIKPAYATEEGFIGSGQPAVGQPSVIPPAQPVILNQTDNLDPDDELDFDESTKSHRGLLKALTAVMAVLLILAGVMALLDFAGLLPSNYSQKITVNKLGNNVQNVTNQVTQLNKQVTTLKGEQGEKGSQGIQGATGPQGPSGINGGDGAAGPQGPSGADGAAGATGPQGPPGSSGSASCPNGQCVSLQAVSPGIQETGNISITGNMNVGGLYLVNGNQLAVSNLADSGNIARLNGTGPQTFTGNNKFTGTVLSQNVFNTTAALQVQNAAGGGILTVDTVNDRVAINQNSANFTLDVNGDINTNGQFRVNGNPISSSNLSDGTNLAKLNVNQTFSGINSFSNASNSFTGNGSGLTQLNASNLTTGTVDDARLPSTLVKVDQNNTFTGQNIFRDDASPFSGSTTAFEIQNTAGSSTLLDADTLNMRIGINKTNPQYTLDVNGTINGTTIQGITLLQNGNAVCDVSGNCTGGDLTVGGSGTPGQIAMFTTGSSTIGDSIISQSGSTIGIAGNLNLTGANPKYEINGSQISSGNLADSNNIAHLNNNQTFTANNTIRALVNGSSTQFQVQTPGGTDILLVDAANSFVGINQNSASFPLDVNGIVNTNSAFSVNGTSGTGLTCSAGDVIQNAVVTGGIVTGGTCVANGGDLSGIINLQNVYDNSSGPPEIITSSTGKNIAFQSGSGLNAASLFQLQNASGNYLFNADTLDSQIQIGQADLQVSEGNLSVTAITSPTPTLASSSSGGSLAATTYFYMLSVNNYHGTSVAVTSSPPSVTTSGSASKNTLTWSAVPNIVSYNIYRSTNGGTSWFVNTIPAGTTTMIDDGTNFTWGTSGTPGTTDTTGGNLTVGGAALFKNASNSTTAFQVQDASGNLVLSADTTNRFVGIGTSGPQAALDVEAPSPEFFDGFETGVLNPFTTTGGWSAVNNNAHSGSWSTTATTSGKTLSLTTTLSAPGTITFWAKTNLGAGGTHFTLKDNGATDLDVPGGLGGGSTPYTKYSFSVGSGSHTFAWATSGAGSTTAFVDDVTVTNAGAGTAAIFNGGNVGIGTSFPTATLEIDGTQLIKPSGGIDTSTLFQVQNAEGGPLLNADSLNSVVTIGQGSLVVTGLGTPSAPVVTNSSNQGGSLSGNPATTYYYKVTAVNTAGKETLASPETSFSASGFTPLTSPGAPSLTTTSGSDLGIGTYRYKITFVTANGETTGGTTASVTTTSGNQDVNVNSIPVGPAGTIARKLYRTVVSGLDGSQQLLTTINDNSTTSFLDNIPDGSLGAGLPGSNTATTNNNETSVSFATIPGAASYHVYRGTLPSAENSYQTTTTIPFIDTGAAGTASSTPTVSGVGSIGIGTSTPSANLDVAGNALFQNAIDTATAFQIQNAAGNSVLGVNTASGQVALGSAGSLSGSLIFNNSSNTNTVAILPGTPTSSYSLTLPSALPISNQCLQTNNTGIITFTACIGGGSATLAAAYGNGSGPGDSTITLDTTRQGMAIQDGASPIGTNLFTVESNGGSTKYFNVAAAGSAFNNTGTTAFQIQKADGTGNLFIADTTDGRIAIDQASANYPLDVAGNINTTTGYRVAGTPGSGITCTSGNVLQNPVVTGGIITGGTCVANGAGATTTLQNAYDNSSSPATITTSSSSKNLIVKAGASNDSTGIFQIQDSSGNSVLNADSVNRFIGINNATPNATLDVLASSSSFMDGFETGTLSPFVNVSNFSVGTGNAHNGSWSVNYGPLNGGGSFTLTKTLSSAGTITFWAKTALSCAPSFVFSVDAANHTLASPCGNFSYTQFSFAVASGTHIFTWSVGSGGGTSTTSVDDVTLTNAGGGTAALFNGGNVGIGTSFPNATLDITGNYHLQAASDNTAEFQIQSANAADTLLTADTTNNKIVIGNATGTNTATTLLVLDSATADPTTGFNGAMYYNTTNNVYRCYVNGVWTNCGSNGTTLQNAYDNSSGPATITTSSAAKNVVIKAGASNDSTGLFQLQDSGGNSILDADSTHRFVGINNAAPNATLDVLASTSGFTDGFETGVLSPFTVTSQWIISSANPHSGSFDAYNNHGQTGALNLVRTLSSTGTISFWIAYNSGGQCSAPLFNIDGVQKLSLPQNTSAPYTMYSFSVASGTHTFTWTGNGCSNFDQEIDDVTVTNAGTGTAALFNGGNVGIGTAFPSATLDITGNYHLQASTDSATEFQIQSANAADTLLTADTTNNKIVIGNATGTNTATTLLVIDSATADPTTGYNGAMYYNSTNNVYRCFANGVWTDCSLNGGGGAIPSLQNVYDASSSPATITTSSAAKNVVVKASVGNDSINLFNVQDSGSNSILDADSTHRFVGINNANPNATLDVLASSSSFTDGFETGSLSPFTESQCWATGTGNSHSGSWSAGFTCAGPPGNLILTKTLNSTGTVSFWANIHDTFSSDFDFRVDGTSKLSFTAGQNNGGYTFYSFSVPSGTHTFSWEVSGGGAGNPFYYVDDVTVTNTGAGTAALFNGGSVGIGTSFPNATLDVTGTEHFQAASGGDSTNLFQIQNAAGTSLFNVDSTNYRITSTNSNLYLTDNSTPTGLNVVAGSNQGGALSGSAATAYYYKVTAVGANGESLASSESSFNGASFTPLTAPTAATVGGPTAGGAVTLGTHSYKITFVTANGETIGGTTSSQVNVTTGGTQTVPLSAIPLGPTGTTQRKIYRTVSGDTGSYLLVTTLNNNTATTFNDVVADGSLGAAAPASNTATTNLNNATVTWTAVTGATSYKIYRGTAAGAENAYQTSASSPFTDTGAAGTSASVPSYSGWDSLGVGTSTPVATLDIAGNSHFKDMVDSTSAFQVQNAGGGNLLNVDSTNSNITVGQGDLLVTGLGTPATPVLSAGSNQGGSFSGAAGTTYFYKITAINSAGNETLASAESSFASSGFTPLTAPTALTAAASASAGNVSCNNTAGQGCKYEVTFVTANGETTGGTASSSVLNVASKQINLTNIPTGPSGTTARKIYRSTNNSAFLLDQTINDNTTTSGTDNLASPAGAIPGANTATTNLNNITVTFTPIQGAASYRIYRGTATGAESAYQTAVASPFTDTGVAGTSASTPTVSSVERVGIGTVAPTANLTVAGNALFKNVVNTTSAFQVQDASGNSALNVDTTNRFVGINNANPNATLDVQASSTNFSDGFESGNLSPFTASGTGTWNVITGSAHTGTSAAKGVTGATFTTDTLSITKTLSGPGTVSFYEKFGGAATFSGWNFQIDGVSQVSANSNQASYALQSFSVSSGTHAFTWNINSGSSGGGVNLTIDDVTITNAGTGTTALFNGGNVGIGTAFPNASLELDGNSLFKAGSDSVTQYQFQNSGGVNVLNIDTTDGSVGVGTGTNTPTAKFQVAGTSTVNTDSATAFQVQNAAATATVLAVNTLTSTVTVTNLVATSSITVNGHITTGNSSGSTTVAAGAAANCTTGSPTVTVNGNDTAGTVTITTATGCSSGTFATVTFANTYGSAPNVVLTPRDATGATQQYYYNSTTTGFDIDTGSTPVDNTTYIYTYHVLQ